MNELMFPIGFVFTTKYHVRFIAAACFAVKQTPSNVLIQLLSCFDVGSFVFVIFCFVFGMTIILTMKSPMNSHVFKNC